MLLLPPICLILLPLEPKLKLGQLPIFIQSVELQPIDLLVVLLTLGLEVLQLPLES